MYAMQLEQAPSIRVQAAVSIGSTPSQNVGGAFSSARASFVSDVLGCAHAAPHIAVVMYRGRFHSQAKSATQSASASFSARLLRHFIFPMAHSRRPASGARRRCFSHSASSHDCGRLRDFRMRMIVASLSAFRKAKPSLLKSGAVGYFRSFSSNSPRGPCSMYSCTADERA